MVLKEVFIQLLYMSIMAGYVVLAVMMARFLLRKRPKIYSYILWSLVAFRLLVPMSVSTSFSFFNLPNFSTLLSNTVTEENTMISDSTVQTSRRDDRQVNPEVGRQQIAQRPLENTDKTSIIDRGITTQKLVEVASVIWISGLALLLLYTFIKVVSMKKQLASAVLWRDNIYEADGIKSPFVFGILRPRIYMPFSLEEVERDYILRHEKEHIRRGDHLVKYAAYMLATAYWFHPLVWMAYYFMCQDMEMSCDEKVIKGLDEEKRKDYSRLLLSFATEKRQFAGPLYFGENNVEKRITNVLRFKRGGIVAAVLGVVLIGALTLFFGTDAKATEAKDVTSDAEPEEAYVKTLNSYEGEWHRTGVASYEDAEIRITNWKEGESFDVEVYLIYTTHPGYLSGTATFLDENTAVLYDEGALDFLNKEENTEDLGIYFHFYPDEIQITHGQSIRLWFGTGGLATAEGSYIQGEPVYTNCTNVSEIFTAQELQMIQDLLGDRYEPLFEDAIVLGEINEWNIENGRLWEAYWPPRIAWCNIIIYDNGDIYIDGITFNDSVYEFFTNTDDIQMPDIETLKNGIESQEPGTIQYNISEEADNSTLTVTDDQGNELYSDTFETSWEPIINRINPDTIEIIYGRGDWHQSVFVNGKTGQVSPLIDDVVASNGEVAVHAGFIDGQMRIVMQDIYQDIHDKEEGYEQIIDDFPLVAVGKHIIKDVTFLDDGRVEISYYTVRNPEADDWTVKTVILSTE